MPSEPASVRTTEGLPSEVGPNFEEARRALASRAFRAELLRVVRELVATRHELEKVALALGR